MDLATRRAFLAALAGALAAHGAEAGGTDAEVVLLMVEQPGCPYCAQWHREVGPAYANSPEGRFAPLVRRMRDHPDVAAIMGLNYSPTFLVMRNGQEIGRITGYPGPDFFWALLGELLPKAGFGAGSSAPRP